MTPLELPGVLGVSLVVLFAISIAVVSELVDRLAEADLS